MQFVGETEPGRAEDSEPACKRVATDHLADALEECTRIPFPDDNVTNDPEVFCREAVSSTTVTEIVLGISSHVQEHRRVEQAFVTSVQRKRRSEGGTSFDPQSQGPRVDCMGVMEQSQGDKTQ